MRSHQIVRACKRDRWEKYWNKSMRIRKTQKNSNKIAGNVNRWNKMNRRCHIQWVVAALGNMLMLKLYRVITCTMHITKFTYVPGLFTEADEMEFNVLRRDNCRSFSHTHKLIYLSTSTADLYSYGDDTFLRKRGCIFMTTFIVEFAYDACMKWGRAWMAYLFMNDDDNNKIPRNIYCQNLSETERIHVWRVWRASHEIGRVRQPDTLAQF